MHPLEFKGKRLRAPPQRIAAAANCLKSIRQVDLNCVGKLPQAIMARLPTLIF
jgi:hypothetical protein